MKKAFFALVIAPLLAGCASSAGSTLTPAYGIEQTGSASAVKTECTAAAAEVMPKSLGFLETIPPSTYMAAYNKFAACAQESGYEAQCQSANKVLCGLNVLGFQ
ncbi:MAG: lipoprotein [Gammaproteobacteria bacterium]